MPELTLALEQDLRQQSGETFSPSGSNKKAIVLPGSAASMGEGFFLVNGDTIIGYHFRTARGISGNTFRP